MCREELERLLFCSLKQYGQTPAHSCTKWRKIVNNVARYRVTEVAAIAEEDSVGNGLIPSGAGWYGQSHSDLREIACSPNGKSIEVGESFLELVNSLRTPSERLKYCWKNFARKVRYGTVWATSLRSFVN